MTARKTYEERPCANCGDTFTPTQGHSGTFCYRCRQRKVADGHTQLWDTQALGVIEAAALRLAWGPTVPSYVTRNCDDDVYT